MNVRKLVTISVLTALSIALVAIVRFPIFSAAPYLEYDPADIPIIIATLTYGPITGLVMTVVVSVIQGLIFSPQSMIYGVFMHIIATGALVLAAGGVYNLIRSRTGVLWGVIFGTVAMAAIMIPANLLITPLFNPGVKSADVVKLLLPIIIPFNVIKAGANGAAAFWIYMPLRGYIEQGRVGAVIGRHSKP